MSRYVRWGESILPRDFFDPVERQPGVCPLCGGLGTIAESIDRERYDAAVPCYRCRFYCATCQDWVKRDGHTCAGAKP